MSSIKTTDNILQYGDSILAKYIKEVNNIPSLDKEAEFILAEEFARTGDIVIANKLIKSQLKTVVRLAFGYKNYGISMMDIIAEGNLGLMHAIKKFHPETGYRLSTYASWWIKAYINDFILKSWSLVKIGTTKLQKRLFFNLAKIKRRLGVASHMSLSGENAKLAADSVGASVEEFNEMDIRITNPDISLNKTDEDGFEFGDSLDSGVKNPEQRLIIASEKQQKMSVIKAALEKLNERERLIFYSRYINENKATLHDLSQKLGISKERIRQIEENVLNKIKAYANQ